jgi:GntR family transcriptional regulator/MocR family aminotransferase
MKPRFKKLPISINQRSGVALSDQLHGALTREIIKGTIAIGEQIPSIRELAADLGVTQAVVRKAFERLIAEGWLEVQQGSGTYVSETASILISQTGAAPRAAAKPQPAAPKPQPAETAPPLVPPDKPRTPPAIPAEPVAPRGDFGDETLKLQSEPPAQTTDSPSEPKEVDPPALPAVPRYKLGDETGKSPAGKAKIPESHLKQKSEVQTRPPKEETNQSTDAAGAEAATEQQSNKPQLVAGSWNDPVTAARAGKDLANKPLPTKSASEAAASAEVWSDPFAAMVPGSGPSPFNIIAAKFAPSVVPESTASPEAGTEEAPNGPAEQSNEQSTEDELLEPPSPSWDDSWSWTGINPEPISDKDLLNEPVKEETSGETEAEQSDTAQAGQSDDKPDTAPGINGENQAPEPDTESDTGKLGNLTSLFFDKSKGKPRTRGPSITSYAKDRGAEEDSKRALANAARREKLSRIAESAQKQGQSEATDETAMQLGAVAGVVASDTAFSTPNFLGLHQDELQAPTNSADWAKDISQVFAHTTVYGASAASQELELHSAGAESRALVEARWETALRSWIEECTKASPSLTEPAGMPDLREQVASWLRASRGMTCTANDIVIVNGAQEGRDLVARVLIDRGRPVVVEEPGSVMHRAFLQANGANLLPVNTDDSGLIIDELENVQEPALLYVCPSSQFPTGAVLPKNRRLHIVDWASINNSIIVEDDSGCEFTYESRVTSSIHSSDTHGRTIYIGSLSHIIPPSWRVGFMVVPKRIRPTLLRLKSLTSRCTSPVVQRLVLKLFESGFMQEQVRKLQRICEQRRQAMLDELSKWPPEIATFSPVKSGFLQTIWLPSSMADIDIYRQCLEKGVAVVPVSPCFLNPPARPGLIINFAAVPSEKMADGLYQLRGILERSLGGESGA